MEQGLRHNNVSNHLEELARSQPGELAVVVASGTGYIEQTAFQLERRCVEICRALHLMGVASGTRVALMVPPGIEFFALTFALLRLEAVPVLIDPGLGVKNVKQALAEARPQLFIGVPRALVARRLLGWGRGYVKKTVRVGGWGLLAGGRSLDRQVARAGRRVESGKGGAALENAGALRMTPADQEAAILFTSGSTGPPKGAVYSHGMFAAQVEILRRDFGIQRGERDLATFPLFALFGPALGMAAVVPDMDTSKPASADPAKLMKAAADYRCTNLFASPALIDKLGRHCQSTGERLSSLRRAISAGAPMPVPVLKRFVEHAVTDGAELLTPYGATECLPVTRIGSVEILSETLDLTARGSGVCVGRPVESVQIKILEIRDEAIATMTEARELGPGQIGEIVVQGPIVSRSYVRRERDTELHKISDGAGFWHRTGDVGYLDASGRLFMCGRKSHRVSAMWGPMFTVPCEAIFNQHPAVRRSALVGVPSTVSVVASREDIRGLEAPVMCIEIEKELQGSVDEAVLLRELRAMAREHSHTNEIEHFLIHPEFPVDIRHNAKIFREQLKKWAALRVKA